MKQALPKRASTWTYALVGAMVLIVAALAGCTMVGDGLTGVQLDGTGPTSCVKECNDFYKLEYENEQKLHIANVEYCQSLSQPDKGACLDAETARHEAAKAALSAGKIECQNNCHRQGSGTAG